VPFTYGCKFSAIYGTDVNCSAIYGTVVNCSDIYSTVVNCNALYAHKNVTFVRNRMNIIETDVGVHEGSEMHYVTNYVTNPC